VLSFNHDFHFENHPNPKGNTYPWGEYCAGFLFYGDPENAQ
jgi:hypothetical protein